MIAQRRPTLAANDLRRLMRSHKCTIRELAQRTGISMTRIREVRSNGLVCPLAARDWIEAVTGQDPGPQR